MSAFWRWNQELSRPATAAKDGAIHNILQTHIKLKKAAILPLSLSGTGSGKDELSFLYRFNTSVNQYRQIYLHYIS